MANLYNLISNLQFSGIKSYKEIDIDSLTINSEEKTDNGMYFCINGTKVDGHDFAKQAVDNGAICLVVGRYLDIPVTQILVDNVRKSMSQLSAEFYETKNSKMKFVGVTGTNGKTTTTFLIKEILSKLGKKVGLIGTEGVYIGNQYYPNDFTTPDPIQLHKIIKQMQESGCEYCVMEVSAHAIALNKIDDINFDVVALSNITQDHLDFFVNMENYIKCKASLFDLSHAKAGVINTDAKYNKGIAKNSNLNIVRIGKDGDIEPLYNTPNSHGTTFSFNVEGFKHTSATNLIGDYNISNLIMAIAILRELGFDFSKTLPIIQNNEFIVPGRFNVLKTGTNFKVVIDYAHTPDGIKNILSSMKKLPHNRVITVFGCGGNRDKTKRGEMGDVAVDLSDYVIVTSDNPRNENPNSIIEDITRNQTAKNLIKITDRKSAIEYALSIAKPDDIVAILGKGAEDYQEIQGVKNHFSDYEVVDNFFKHVAGREM